MLGYWLKNRFALDALLCIVLVLILAFAFVLPIYANYAASALASAPYENECVDFDIPAPAESQIEELEAMSFIESVFPYYFTKVGIALGDKVRETNLLLAEPSRSLDATMYSDLTLIERLESRPENPIYIDYLFAKESGVKLGDTVSLTLGGEKIDFVVYQINESNSYYNGGAVLVEWSGRQKAAISAASPSVRYSGAFIDAKDYAAAKRYLENDYRALGRLKDASEFSTPEAYNSHLETITKTSCRNEITDFSLKRSDAGAVCANLEGANIGLFIFEGLLVVIIIAAYNFVLWLRASERGYFAHRKVNGETSILSYYFISSSAIAFMLLLGAVISVLVIPGTVGEFIPAGESVLTAWVTVAIALVSSVVGFAENLILEKLIRD